MLCRHERLDSKTFDEARMITDSTPWKTEVTRIADRLEQRKLQRRWTERTSFLIERDIMVAAYALRKLLEAHKISDLLASRRIAICEHSLLDDSCPPDAFNRYFIWENYDLNVIRERRLTIRALCNQIIHSWNWMISTTEADQFNGFYVSSDRERLSSVYFIDLDIYIDLLRSVGNDHVVSTAMSRDERGEMQITSVIAKSAQMTGP
jgi:hypothetical protein